MARELLKVCLVTDAAVIQRAVQASCLPPHELVVFSYAGTLDARQGLSEYGRQIVQAASEADVVLLNWQLAQAPLVNMLGHQVRVTTLVPVIALCGAGQEEMIAALTAGVDEVVTLPLYMPLLQARIVAHHRLVRAVRKISAKKVKKKLKSKKDRAVARTVDGMEPPGGIPYLAATPADAAEAEELHAPEAVPGKSPEPGKAPEAIAETMVEHFVNGLAEELIEGLLAETDPAGRFGNGTSLEVGPLRLDVRSYRFYAGDEEVELTPKEFELLYFLMQHPGVACTRDQILDEVWGIDFDTGTNMVDVYMHFVRRKLSAHGLKDMLQTVRGRGYRLIIPEKTPAS